MTVALRFRDAFRNFTPVWLLDRITEGFVTGYKFLFGAIAPLDCLMQNAVEGIQAAYPGLGTSSALLQIGRTRGLQRGQGQSDDSYIAQLLQWRELWQRAGSAEAIALAVQTYLSSHPRVRVVTRTGRWVTLETNGTFTYATAPWNWDSISNPERNDPAAPWWSEIFVIIYPTQWPVSSTLGFLGASSRKLGDLRGIGHLVTHAEQTFLRSLFAQWKSAHTKIRCVIWTYNASQFDPANPGSLMPNGVWGEWATFGPLGSPTDPFEPQRDPSCRYWET